MATVIDRGDSLFLDSSYAIALSAPTDQFHQRALRLAAEIEIVSFVVMTERGVSKALTADEHFQQCGFRALLSQSSNCFLAESNSAAKE